LLSLSDQIQGPLSEWLSEAGGFSICRRQSQSFPASLNLSPQPIFPSTTGFSSGHKGTGSGEAGSQEKTLHTQPVSALFLHHSRPGLLCDPLELAVRATPTVKAQLQAQDECAVSKVQVSH